MSTDKIVALFKDKEFIEKYNSCKNPLEKSELLSKNGVSISEDEIKSLENYTKNGSSIEDNDLQNISGGVKFKSFVKGAALILVSAAGAAGLVYVGGKFLDSKKKSSKIIPNTPEEPAKIATPPVDHMGTPLGSPDLDKMMDSMGTEEDWDHAFDNMFD